MLSNLVPFLASGIMIASFTSSTDSYIATSSAKIVYPSITQRDNFASYMEERNKIKFLNSSSVDSELVMVDSDDEDQPVGVVSQEIVAAKDEVESGDILYDQTEPLTYEQVYKEAGVKYGIPWEILYGIHMTETGGRNGSIMSGFGTGAQGPMQFMPGTWRAYGVDGDGDGIADINNAVDAIHGAANYLAMHGSLDQGLRSYGGNISGTLRYAREVGYSS